MTDREPPTEKSLSLDLASLLSSIQAVGVSDSDQYRLPDEDEFPPLSPLSSPQVSGSRFLPLSDNDAGDALYFDALSPDHMTDVPQTDVSPDTTAPTTVAGVLPDTDAGPSYTAPVNMIPAMTNLITVPAPPGDAVAGQGVMLQLMLVTEAVKSLQGQLDNIQGQNLEAVAIHKAVHGTPSSSDPPTSNIHLPIINSTSGTPSNSRPPHSFATEQSFFASLQKIAWSNVCLPADASAWFDKIRQMMTHFGIFGGNDFCSAIIYAFSGCGLTWLHSILSSLPLKDWSFDFFKEKFMARFAGQVRSPTAVALESLVQRRIFMQPSESIESYSERFLSISRLVPSITGAALCQHYISGLSDTLRGRCVLNMFNQEWTSLESLMNHSFAEHLRLTLSTPIPHLLHAPVVAPTSLHPNPRRWNPAQRLAVSHFLQEQPSSEDVPMFSADYNVQLPPAPSTLTHPQSGTPNVVAAKKTKSSFLAAGVASVHVTPPSRSSGTSTRPPIPTLPNSVGLPSFCSFDQFVPNRTLLGSANGHAHVGTFENRPVYFFPPVMSQSDLERLPGYGTDGRARNGVPGVQLKDIHGSYDALTSNGVCTFCRRGRHPIQFCPVKS